MAQPRVLVADDDDKIRELLELYLTKEGFAVEQAADGAEAILKAQQFKPDLIVLDIMMPVLDGMEVCRQVRKFSQVPVIMLTARTEDEDRIMGLELGADDYLAKPFSPRVLIARIKAVLRRRQGAMADDDAPISVGEFVIHPGRHEVTVAGKLVDLTLTEFRLLQFLTQRPGWAFSRAQIVDAVKGEDYPVTERSVDVQVAGLRKKLGDHGHYVETVRGVGYRFKG